MASVNLAHVQDHAYRPSNTYDPVDNSLSLLNVRVVQKLLGPFFSSAHVRNEFTKVLNAWSL